MEVVQKHKMQAKNEQGFAAIVIAIVLVIILSLITVGFAELMRHEQASATDKHLSSQAYYNAESGINDAAKAINAGYTDRKLTCATTGLSGLGSQFLTNEKIGTDNNNNNSCLLIDPAPNSLEFGAIPTSNAKVFYMTGVNDNDTLKVPFGSIKISWKNDTGGDGNAPSCTSFPSQPSWGAATGMVRLGVTPIGGMGVGVGRDDMIANSYTSFLCPGGGSANNPATYSTTTTGDKSGEISEGGCTATPVAPDFNCSATLTFSSGNITDVMVNLRSIYHATHVIITAKDGGGNPIHIRNAQTLVDSTGRAQDVLRRVQVRIPSKNNFYHPDYALEAADDVCKQYNLLPNGPAYQSSAACNAATP